MNLWFGRNPKDYLKCLYFYWKFLFLLNMWKLSFSQEEVIKKKKNQGCFKTPTNWLIQDRSFSGCWHHSKSWSLRWIDVLRKWWLCQIGIDFDTKTLILLENDDKAWYHSTVSAIMFSATHSYANLSPKHQKVHYRTSQLHNKSHKIRNRLFWCLTQTLWIYWLGSCWNCAQRWTKDNLMPEQNLFG